MYENLERGGEKRRGEGREERRANTTTTGQEEEEKLCCREDPPTPPPGDHGHRHGRHELNCAGGGGKYVYQPMTNVLQLPSTTVPSGAAGDHAPSLSISALLADRFLRTASCLASPTSGRGGSGEDYAVTRINGRAFYVPLARRSKKPGAALTNTQHQNGEHTQPGLPSCSRSVLSNRNETTARLQVSDRGSVGQKPRSGFSPSGPEDSGIPGVERTYGDPELNQEHSKVGSEGLKEDRWDLSPLQELAEALETTV
ncbi:hypothetical protein NHX12_022496 [Muraenolepis orangiensis]|uniref:Uncharacterized protein n=1 Tax=Muraenolepis orangiensis TaxID=630683 RepID=A0A9Q0ITK4_9TELE|nr:hypothetical protein NHX12_022496 [Muraenolepis orangiensis]